MTATIVLLIIAALSAGLLFVLPWAVQRAEMRRRIARIAELDHKLRVIHEVQRIVGNQR